MEFKLTTVITISDPKGNIMCNKKRQKLRSSFPFENLPKLAELEPNTADICDVGGQTQLGKADLHIYNAWILPCRLFF